MASSLRVNAIVPASGTNVAIGTAGGTVTYAASVSGISTFSSGIVVAAGSTSAPSISPTGDSNTGIFFPSADTVCIGEGGTEVIRVDSSGNVGINTTTFPANGTNLKVSNDTFSRILLDKTGTNARSFSVGNGGTYLNVYDETADAERLRIDSSGRVTMPYQPSFFAYKNGADTTTNVGSIIVFDGTSHNIGSNYSTSTGKFTAPVAGVYAFHAQIWAKNATSLARTQFFVNSGNVTQHGMNPAGVNLSDHTYQMSMVRFLSANDTVDIRVDSSNLTYYAGGGSSHSFFSGYLIG